MSPSRREGPRQKGARGLIFSIAHPSGNLFSRKGRCPFVPIDVVSHLTSTNVGAGEPQQTARPELCSLTYSFPTSHDGELVEAGPCDSAVLTHAGEKCTSPGLLRPCYCHRAQHALEVLASSSQGAMIPTQLPDCSHHPPPPPPRQTFSLYWRQEHGEITHSFFDLVPYL